MIYWIIFVVCAGALIWCLESLLSSSIEPIVQELQHIRSLLEEMQEQKDREELERDEATEALITRGTKRNVGG